MKLRGFFGPLTGAFIVAAVTVVFLTAPHVRSWSQSPVAKVVSIFNTKDGRPIEPRLSGGIEWAPFRPPQPDSASMAPANNRGSDDDASHVNGVALLLTGKTAQALSKLEAAASPNDPAAWNDLAVALHEAALRYRVPEQIAQALAAADRALVIDPNYAEALFNRALMLQRLGFRDDALIAWQRYLDVDAASGWAAEARSHVAALAPQEPFQAQLDRQYEAVFRDPGVAEGLTARDPFGARGACVKVVLGRWGHAMLRGDEGDAARHLQVARRLAVPVTRNGDHLLERAIAAIDAADGDARLELATAHATYFDSLSGDPGAAESPLRRSAALFARHNSPMGLAALLFAASSVHVQGRPDEASAQYESLLRIATASEYPAYRGLLLWSCGLNREAKGEWGKAIELFEESRTLFEKVRENGNAAMVRGLLANVYDRIGDPARAWEQRVSFRDDLGVRADEAHAEGASSIAGAAILRNDWHTALSFLSLRAAMLERMNYDASLADTLFLRSVVRDRLQDVAGSRADFAAAREFARVVKDPAYRVPLRAAERRAEAMFASTPQQQAEALLSEAIEFQTTRGDPHEVPGLLLQRARLRRAAGNAAGAMADVERGITDLERQRESLPAGEARWGAFHSAKELFEVGVGLAMDRDDAGAAFAFAERARARALLDSYGRSPALDFRELPARTVVVEYVALPERLIIFTADTAGLHATAVEVSRATLAREIEGLARSVRDGSPQPPLYRRLIEPIEPRLRGAARIAFVADATTANIPFCAIRDGAGAYLLERHAVVNTPSAAAFAAIAERRGEAMRRPRTVLLVTAPDANDDSAVLAFVEGEAKRIAGEYADPVQIADAGELAAHAAEADVIHFGGHGVGDERGLEPASLIVRKGGREHRLSVSQIARLRLRSGTTVVLAGCGTARGERRAAEGVISVAHGFLAAGAASVIATQWPIDDADAARFFPRLHRALAQGVAPAEALRETQLESIRRGDVPPSLWAAVQDIGS
ncbi:MAG TPA: CHAT domain-containing protein [Thermoanaerobaculia bacterium]